MCFRVVQFTTSFAGSRGIEISKRSVVNSISMPRMLEFSLELQLRLPVGIRRLQPVGFRNGLTFRFAVNRRRRREYDLSDAGTFHGFEKYPACDNVIVEILLGVLYGFPHKRRCGH